MGDSSVQQAHRDQSREARRCLEVHRYCPRHLLNAVSSAASGNHLVGNDQIAKIHVNLGAGYDENQHAPLLAIAQLATFRLDADDCTVSLIDDKYQYVLARTGRCLPMLQTPDSHSDNSSTLEQSITQRNTSIDSLVLDRALDTNSADTNVSSLMITNLNDYDLPSTVSLSEGERSWSSYAGTALLSVNKTVIGVFSVKNYRLSSEHEGQTIAILEDLAKIVSNLLQAQLAHEERSRAETMINGLHNFTTGDHPHGSTATVLLHDDAIEEHENLQVPTQQNPSDEHDFHSHQSIYQSAPIDTPGEEVQHSSLSINSSRQSSVAQIDLADNKTLSVGNVSQTETRKTENNTSQAPHSTDFQKSLLPPSTQIMFARAAKTIRKAGDFDGVVFVDAAIVSLGQSTGLVPDRDDSPSRNTANATNRQSRSSSDSRQEGDSSSSDTPLTFRTATESGPRTCMVLGSSVRKYPDGTESRQAEEPFHLPEKILHRVLRTHPQGRIIHFLAESAVTTSSDETSDSVAPKMSTQNGQSNNSKASSVSRSLKTLLPRARSLCLLPIWNYERERWFSCCIAWTDNPRRILSPTVELVYLKTFGSAIMAELGRLGADSTSRKKTTFISSISHELRSPLHGILGSVGFLQNTELDAFQAAMLLSIRTCGNTLVDVVDHVLDVTQMEALQGQGRSTLHYRDDQTVHLISDRRSAIDPTLNKLSTIQNLTTATEEVVESMYASLSFQVQGTTIDEHNSLQVVPSKHDNESAILSGGIRKPVLIILELPRELEAAVDIPVGAWRRILMNLVGNAIKYTVSGYIRVTVKLGPSTKSLDRKFSRLTLSVCDTGIGMSRNFLVNRIFKAFNQEDSFSSGVGLGLHLVRQIVTSLHGNIKIQSVVDKGTNIRVGLDVPKAGIRSHISEKEEDDRMKQAKEDMKTKSVCILHNYRTNSAELEGSVTQGMKLFGDAIRQTLQEWLDIEPVITSKLDKHNVDIVIMLESSFEQLQDLRSQYQGGLEMPIVLMLAKDAVEAGTLRTDVRVSSGGSIVEVISQPCGPIKLANILVHCLNRRSTLQARGRSPLKSQNNSPLTPATAAAASLSPSSSYSYSYSASSSTSTSGSSYSEVPSSTIQETPSKMMETGQTSDSAEAQALGSKKVVLIVDDNPINRRLLATMLRKNKMAYIEAENGLQALQSYKRLHQNISIILMDISMPVMDGMTATRRIRQFERAENMPRIKIFALTGLVSVCARLEAFECGVDDVLTKPVKFTDLLIQIRSLTIAADGEEETTEP